MDILAALGRTIPFAFTSGINLYATVAVLGLCSRYQLLTLPEQFRAFGHPIVIGLALTMYAIEFVADKVPWVDSIWDAVHTVIRPVGGAIVAVTALGGASGEAQATMALLGASVAAATHVTKSGTRAVVNTSPEPFSNWFLSFGEDIFVVAFTYVALQHPIAALTVSAVLLGVMALFASVLVRAVRRRFRRGDASSRQSTG
ncbi:MAG: DUF4126 domain-containing protein [Acidobacteriota bacterium]